MQPANPLIAKVSQELRELEISLFDADANSRLALSLAAVRILLARIHRGDSDVRGSDFLRAIAFAGSREATSADPGR